MLPPRELHSEVKALRGHSEQLEMILPFQEASLVQHSRKLLSLPGLDLAVATHSWFHPKPPVECRALPFARERKVDVF